MSGRIPDSSQDPDTEFKCLVRGALGARGCLLGIRQQGRNRGSRGLDWSDRFPSIQGPVMADVIFVAAIVAFFVISLLVLRGLERL